MYFKSVNSLLSKQLREVIVRTVEEFRDFLVGYAEGNAFEGEYRDLMFIRYVVIFLFLYNVKSIVL